MGTQESGVSADRPHGEKLKLPGFGLPVTLMPDEDHCFPHLYKAYNSHYNSGWRAKTLLTREVCMFKLVEEITNKPDWWTKVNDPVIAQKWKDEALAMDWTRFRQWADFTPQMADACIAELRQKAMLYEQTGLIPVFDYSVSVIKSDRLMSESMVTDLVREVAVLEDVPDDQKDWHPGSDEKVLDLVHPSMYPLVYGRSRIMPNRQLNVNNCLEHCGIGVTIKPNDHPEILRDRFPSDKYFSKRFQWLPCDVVIDGDEVKIDSYINNLHPTRHRALYSVIEKFIKASLPAWDILYRWPDEFDTHRLTIDKVSHTCHSGDACGEHYCSVLKRPLDDDEPPRQMDEDHEDWYQGSDREKKDLEWYVRTHPLDLPEPKADAEHHLKLNPRDVLKSGYFSGNSRIQVIVKLANIHLTPDKPTYDGGSWHVEGQLNEHICATALFYYDCDNITDCHLGFRARANEKDIMMKFNYEQSDVFSMERAFDIREGHGTLQDVGSVLTRPGRAVFFPNILQHHVSPFSLADRSRPGHSKILALFLVDPVIPVISTANVAPQQRQWWVDLAGVERGSKQAHKLPPELMDMVLDSVDFPLSEADAREIRQELMAERTRQKEDHDYVLALDEWSFGL